MTLADVGEMDKQITAAYTKLNTIELEREARVQRAVIEQLVVKRNAMARTLFVAQHALQEATRPQNG